MTADDLDGNEDADGLDGDEDEVAVLGVRVLVSDLFLLGMLPRRDAVQFLSRWEFESGLENRYFPFTS